VARLLPKRSRPLPSQVMDVVWSVLVLLGIEKLRIVPGSLCMCTICRFTKADGVGGLCSPGS
jgi:hypothetical protein